jgi:glycerol kinase
VIDQAGETEALAEGLLDNAGVYMVPAFVGLGAPHWDDQARGAIHGLTLDSTPAHLARAALEAVAYQTLDLLDAMRADGAGGAEAMRIDGGMTSNGWMCQFLADILEVTVERPAMVETTALGAAFHAGLATGVWPDLVTLKRLSGKVETFRPNMAADRRQHLLEAWRKALARTLDDSRFD